MVKLATSLVYLRSRSHCLFLVVQLRARPVDGVGGGGIEAFEMVVGGAVFVVIALHAGDVHVPDDFEAFLGIGVVADDVAEADVMRRLLASGVLQNGLERLQIAVNVSDDGKLHCISELFQNREIHFARRSTSHFRRG